MADIPETAAISTAPAVAASLSTMQQLGNNATNVTAAKSLLSSSRDILTFPFRAIYRADTFAFSTLPRQAARLVGLDNMASQIMDYSSGTGLGGEAVAAGTQAAEAMGDGTGAAAAGQESGMSITDVFLALRRFSGFFSYLTSRWSLACFTVALVLNRITIYASTRRHLHLRWDRRLALRIIPILLFVSQIHSILRAMRCQTSPDYPLIRYGSPGKGMLFDNAGGGGLLYSLSSTLLPWETDEQSCSAVSMGSPVKASDIPYGSFALLWPVFVRLCLSHFVETLSCALQGRPVISEAGMSIFEHSLAFAEAESLISQSIGLGIFGLPKQGRNDASHSGEGAHTPLHMLTRAQVLERMNVTPELLLIALISCCNSLTSNLLDVIGKQSHFRLFHTAFWGLCFMAAMVLGLATGTPVNSETGMVKLPTVCLVGFVPHLLILLGIVSCLAIYAVALSITAFSLPLNTPQPTSLREKLSLAHENMQGASQISSIHFNRHEDFYTALLRIGYTSLTAASDAVFLNEGGGVVARNMTWLEEDRLAEIEASQGKFPVRQNFTEEKPFDGDGNVTFNIPERPSEWESGYGREKKIDKPKGRSRSPRSPADPGGVGAFRGATRFYHGFSFFRAIFYLLLKWTAYVLNRLLDRIGINARPQWLKTMAGQNRNTRARNENTTEPLDFWILTDDGELELPEDSEFDVEREIRKRERSSVMEWERSDERRLDEKLYGWWKAGGSWGNQDQSPDYKPPDSEDFDDTTSMASMSTAASESEWEDHESDGRRTPTQEEPFPGTFTREETPAPDALMDIRSLARLLDPRDQASREEARVLAAHLSADRGGRILTRRQFQQEMEREKARVILSARQPQLAAAQSDNDERRPTPEEETEMLENLILSRRAEASTFGTSSDGQTWETGASGLGPDGPPCVICQTSHRSIIAWPCRCLCVCEECRVSLAMNNFGNCVTCRQEVTGFMRLWVP